MTHRDRRTRLTLCMIVRNERDRLSACLQSVKGLVDEIIVVDTGSADGTPEFARALGAEVVHAPWHDDFGQARNQGLARARGAWILVLDADEVLPAASREEIRLLVERPPTEAFHLITRSTLASGEVVRGAVVRLFPNRPEVRYRRPIHEEVNGELVRAGIPLRASAIEIVHAGYSDEATLVKKRARNRLIIERALTKDPAFDEALYLRFYSGNLFRDEQQWARATADYAWCIANATATSAPVAEAARLLMAECLFENGDVSGARAALAALSDGRHPAALALNGEIAGRSGDLTEAREWFEKLLSAPDIAYQPPVALSQLKIRAKALLAARDGADEDEEHGPRPQRSA